MILFSHNEVIKQALREAIQRRQSDLEAYVSELRKIEKQERENEEAVIRQMQQQ